MSEHGKPNPVVNAISNAVGALRTDPDMHELAKAFDELEPKAIEKLSATEARAQPTIADAVKRLLHKHGRDSAPEQLVPGVVRSELGIPTDNGTLHALVYTPAGNGGDLPVVVFFHGGGWVIASAEVYDASARGLAREAHAIVVSVDYRLAPENRFPAAWDDALESYRWALDNARSLGGDPARIALAGESAGGNLALATAIAARDAGLPAPRHVLAVYPVAQAGSLHTESYIENAIAKPLNKAMMEWFFDHVLRSDADKRDTRLDLVDADLAGLPPVTIISAAIDPLRSDGRRLEDAIKDAGGLVERHVYTGVPHEFFGCAAVVEKAREAQAFAGVRLRDSLN